VHRDALSARISLVDWLTMELGMTPGLDTLAARYDKRYRDL